VAPSSGPSILFRKRVCVGPYWLLSFRNWEFEFYFWNRSNFATATHLQENGWEERTLHCKLHAMLSFMGSSSSTCTPSIIRHQACLCPLWIDHRLSASSAMLCSVSYSIHYTSLDALWIETRRNTTQDDRLTLSQERREARRPQIERNLRKWRLQAIKNT
jgi:hypothetical protein